MDFRLLANPLHMKNWKFCFENKNEILSLPLYRVKSFKTKFLQHKKVDYGYNAPPTTLFIKNIFGLNSLSRQNHMRESLQAGVGTRNPSLGSQCLSQGFLEVWLKFWDSDWILKKFGLGLRLILKNSGIGICFLKPGIRTLLATPPPSILISFCVIVGLWTLTLISITAYHQVWLKLLFWWALSSSMRITCRKEKLFESLIKFRNGYLMVNLTG